MAYAQANAADLVAAVDRMRRAATSELAQEGRGVLGQFMTPPPVATFMAAMLGPLQGHVRLLDPGAGIGSLTVAVVAAALAQPEPPACLEPTTYETDATLLPYLERSLAACREACDARGVRFEARVVRDDFLADCAGEVGAAETSLSGARGGRGGDTGLYDAAILNPPYRKVGAASEERRLCASMGFEAPNLYAGFLGAALLRARAGAPVVAIVPRSFANGTYFRGFRRFLLASGSLDRVHVFDSRREAFRDDKVLQENVILRISRGTPQAPEVETTSSAAPTTPLRARAVPWGQVVRPSDPERFIHLLTTDAEASAADRMARVPGTFGGLGLGVSTGPVVDFRALAFLSSEPRPGDAPLLYPAHLRNGRVLWPRPGGAKWNGIALNDETRRLLVPDGVYVIVKRFTAKEERRRLVATVCEGGLSDNGWLGIENHLNYFHRGGVGLEPDLARGLALYLNTTLVDTYFRLFSGHTQVNASDLRSLPYPDPAVLAAAGRAVDPSMLDQGSVDRHALALLGVG